MDAERRGEAGCFGNAQRCDAFIANCECLFQDRSDGRAAETIRMNVIGLAGEFRVDVGNVGNLAGNVKLKGIFIPVVVRNGDFDGLGADDGRVDANGEGVGGHGGKIGRQSFLEDEARWNLNFAKGERGGSKVPHRVSS